MRTRSQSRENFPRQEASPAIVEPLRIENPFLEDQFQEDPPKDPPEVPMADDRTMAKLLRAPTEGYEDAIVIPEIAANNFELKHGLINLVQNKQYFGHEKEDPHAHIRYFNKITFTIRVPNVPSSSIKLMLFHFSLEGAARIWLEKEAHRFILTWEDLVSKFINQFFPPSKTINLRNEITRFQQNLTNHFMRHVNVSMIFLGHLVEIVLFIVDSGCSKHMTGNLKLLINFVEKFLGTVKFGNDHIAPILRYGDLVQGAVMIKRVYYVEGLNHNLFSVGQFCDADLEVAFRKSTCYIRDLKGNDLLTGSRGTDLYSIIL
nr:reverse transcriptase domain-containing protein [Tanacetum cinerariifolium]